jgi:Uma2 family endonuclease
MSRPATVSTLASLYEQLLILPENLTGEIIDGELYAHPRPSGRHGVVEAALNIRVGGPFHFGDGGGPGGWWIIPEPEVHFVRDKVVVVPDLAGWRREKMPVIPEDHRFEVAPDWVCEILSPSTAKLDRIKKLPLYAHYGVGHVWLVDPLARTLEAYSLHADQWLLVATLQDDEPVSVVPFDAISFSLADLWA